LSAGRRVERTSWPAPDFTPAPGIAAREPLSVTRDAIVATRPDSRFRGPPQRSIARVADNRRSPISAAKRKLRWPRASNRAQREGDGMTSDSRRDIGRFARSN